MIRPSILTSVIHRPIIILSRAYIARTLSGPVQCFVARSAYWITMNPLTTRRKALKVALRPLPLSTSREKVSPLYATRCEESSEFRDLSPSYSATVDREPSWMLHSWIYRRSLMQTINMRTAPRFYYYCYICVIISHVLFRIIVKFMIYYAFYAESISINCSSLISCIYIYKWNSIPKVYIEVYVWFIIHN